MAFRMQVQCLTIYAYIYNLNANVYVNQTLPFDKISIALNAFVMDIIKSCCVFCNNNSTDERESPQ